MLAFPRAYLAAVRASVAGGKPVPVGRLVTLRGAAHEVDAALVDLMNGRALDLPPPAPTPELEAAARAAGIEPAAALDELLRWQEAVRDWLLRGTIAPVGDLGWITVQDEVQNGSQIQRVRFLAAPQLRAAVAHASPPPPIDPERLTAILRVHASVPVDVTGDLADLNDELDRLGYPAAAAAPPGPGVPPAIALLQRRCATRRLAHIRIVPDAAVAADAIPFAHDGDVIAACARGDADPGVFAPGKSPHRCPDDHPVRLSQWLAAMLLAADLERLAPASFPEPAMAAIAEELAPFGRVAGALAHFVLTGPAWWRPPAAPPPPPPAAMRPRTPVPDWITITADPLTLRIAPGLDVPIARLFEIYPVPAPDGQAWLRLWGCFHDAAPSGTQNGITIDLGPMPAQVAGATAAQLRRTIGLPRSLDVMMSTRALVGRTVSQWVDVLGTWSPGDPAWPNFDGLFLHLPRTGTGPPPPPGARLRVHGLFDGPESLYALQWLPA